ncbi:MAG: hypothetical protein NTZ61_08595, partial [Proteobacteria bacterium]|nr:hypothetical protein [Pseudomonadota bacterium]
LTAEAEELNHDLRNLGRVIDRDFPNVFTRDRENFLEPFHTANSEVAREAPWGEPRDPEMTRRGARSL